MTENLGRPNKFRQQHYPDGYNLEGIDEVQQRLRESGSDQAIVRTTPKSISKPVNECLSDAQRIAFALYCWGKEASQGSPSLTRSSASIDGSSAYDMTPVTDAALSEPHLDEFDAMCIGLAKFIECYLTEQNKLLASGLYRATFPEGKVKIRWRAIAEHFTKSKNPQQQMGSLKTMLGILSQEMARLLKIYWNKYPPSDYCKERIQINVAEIFAL